MPRASRGPRLQLFGPDAKHGAKAKAGFTEYLWYIVWSEKGKRRERSTGASLEDRADAEAALADFLASRALEWSGARRPDQVTVADVLSVYGTEHAPHVADPQRIADCIVALVNWWTDQAVSAVTANTCRGYAKARMAEGRKSGTVRRELATLRSAIRYCYREGKLTQEVPVVLPEKGAARDLWLTRTEAAILLRAARKESKAKGHLPNFIILTLYTGRRKEAVLSLQWQPNTVAGHIDLEGGRIDFQGRRVATKKKRGRIQIPQRLMTFLRYWRRRTRQYVLEYGGRPRIKIDRHRLADGTIREYRYDRGINSAPQPIGDVKHAFHSACLRAAEMAEERAGKAKAHAEREAWRASAAKFRKATPHILRHTAVSWLVQDGVPFADIGKFVAMSAEMVERVYGHLAPDRDERVLASIDRRSR